VLPIDLVHAWGFAVGMYRTREMGGRAWARWSLKRHASDIGVLLCVVSMAWQGGAVGVMPGVRDGGCSAREEGLELWSQRVSA
jgi:hypothetical protein